MRFDGRWYTCHDGVVRPLVLAEILPAGGSLLDVVFLVDTGADRTRLSSHFRAQLSVPEGEAELNIIIRFFKSVAVPCPVLFESEPAPREYSILGRDVLDSFAVVVNRSRNLVALLTADHGYTLADA